MGELDATSLAAIPIPKRNMLFLTQRIPYPPIKGEKIRPLQILRHFEKTYNIYLGCLIDDPNDWDHTEIIKSFCTEAYFARLNRRWDYLSHVGALLKGQALSVALYKNRGLSNWISKILEEVPIDVVFVCSSNMAPYVLEKMSPVLTSVVDIADVDSEKWRAYASKASGAMSWIYQREAKLVFELEKHIAEDATFSTFVSEPEAHLFRALVPHRANKVVSVTSGIDHSYFDPDLEFDPPFDPELPTFVFTGTMDYIPNVDAVTWFAREIFPIIRQTLPTAQFHIVGANPAAAVSSLSEISGVFVSGRVPDVRPYLAHARAAVAPMRIARGIQNKVMEAMAMAKSVIVTSDALEGIVAIPGEELILANDAGSFAAAACRLAENRSERYKIGAAARTRMVEQFSWESQLRGFDALLKS